MSEFLALVEKERVTESLS